MGQFAERCTRTSSVQWRFLATEQLHPFAHNATAERQGNTEAPGHHPQARWPHSSSRFCPIGMFAGGQGRLETDLDAIEDCLTFSDSLGVPRPPCLGPEE